MSRFTDLLASRIAATPGSKLSLVEGEHGMLAATVTINGKEVAAATNLSMDVVARELTDAYWNNAKVTKDTSEFAAAARHYAMSTCDRCGDGTSWGAMLCSNCSGGRST